MTDRGVTRAEFLIGALAASLVPARLSAAAATYDFWFTRLRYESGDWDVDRRMPSNMITALIDYTNLRVDPKEHVVALADPKMLTAPFCYLAGHKLVEFNPAEKRNFATYVRNGGFVLVDDCNHDIDGLFAKSFERQMAAMFGPRALAKLPNNHPIYRRFFKFTGPPPTGLELNGWAAGRPLLQQGLWMRMGLRLAQQAFPGGRQYPLRRQHRALCAERLIR